MDCEKFAKMLDNYENLSDFDKAQLEDHAKVCPECKRELEFFNSVISITKTLPRIDVPDNFLDTLNARIDKESKPQSIVLHLRTNARRYFAAAACLMLAVVIGANRDMLMGRMSSGDNENGVITTITTVDTPVSTPAVKAVETEAKETSAPAPMVTEKAVKENKVKAVKPQIKTDNNEVNETAAPQIISEPVTTIELNEPAVANMPSAYAVDATEAPTKMPEEMEYGLSERGNDSTYALAGKEARGNEDEGYSIYADGLIIISEEDYVRAMDIIIEYVTGIYNNYYFMNTSSIGEMRERLYEAQIEFEDYITASSEDITFRIITH